MFSTPHSCLTSPVNKLVLLMSGILTAREYESYMDALALVQSGPTLGSIHSNKHLITAMLLLVVVPVG